MGFIETTNHRPTDHQLIDPPTTHHLPFELPTTYPPTYVKIEDEILNANSVIFENLFN